MEKTKSELEQQETTNAADLQTLERELASARSKHETETKAVSDLRVRVGEQAAQLKQLRADVISAESDLNAMRMEKDELEQSFLRDKEEVRGLHKQVKELEDEKTGLKLLLEKVRKEARQQKGLVSIAKKQVSTAEAGRDAAQAEVRNAEQANKDYESSQAEVTPASPLSTPRALSPNATGASQRSTNPFERFRTPSADMSPARTAETVPGALLAGAALSGGAAVSGAAAAGGVTAGPDTQFDQGSAESTESRERDPFGMHSTASAAVPVVGFDDSFKQQVPAVGFDDSFSQQVPSITAQTPTDFDSAFADFDTEDTAPPVDNIAPAVADPSGPSAAEAETDLGRPEQHDRSLSTQAIPPSSHRATPLSTEQHPGEQPSAEHPEANNAEPIAATVSGDAESSDDEEGPEDVEGPRRTYGKEHRSPSLEAAPQAASVDADAEHPAARVRRHAPPPPAGRQSSRSDSVATPSADERTAITSPLSVASGTVDPFGAPLDAPPRSSVDRQPQADASKSDFGESFDPLSANPGPSAVQTSGTLDVPGAFPAPADESLGAPKASEFDDESEFDFSDKPPTANQAAPAINLGVPGTHDLPATPFGQPPKEQEEPQDVSQLRAGTEQQPPQQSQQLGQQPVANAFDDEFANFDEDFGDFPSQPSLPNSTSDNNSSMLRSYEVVGPDHVKQMGDGGMDAWGVSNSYNSGTASQPSALSFDDAFGGEFTPAP